MSRVICLCTTISLICLLFPQPAWLMVGSVTVPTGPSDICLNPC